MSSSIEQGFTLPFEERSNIAEKALGFPLIPEQLIESPLLPLFAIIPSLEEGDWEVCNKMHEPEHYKVTGHRDEQGYSTTARLFERQALSKKIFALSHHLSNAPTGNKLEQDIAKRLLIDAVHYPSKFLRSTSSSMAFYTYRIIVDNLDSRLVHNILTTATSEGSPSAVSILSPHLAYAPSSESMEYVVPVANTILNIEPHFIPRQTQEEVLVLMKTLILPSLGYQENMMFVVDASNPPTPFVEFNKGGIYDIYARDYGIYANFFGPRHNLPQNAKNLEAKNTFTLSPWDADSLTDLGKNAISVITDGQYTGLRGLSSRILRSGTFSPEVIIAQALQERDIALPGLMVELINDVLFNIACTSDKKLTPEILDHTLKQIEQI